MTMTWCAKSIGLTSLFTIFGILIVTDAMKAGDSLIAVKLDNTLDL